VQKYQTIEQREVRWTGSHLDDAEIAVIAFGTPARVSLSAVRAARADGVRAGLFRPITLFPFPKREVAELAHRVKGILVVELNQGQMLQDVERIVGGRVPVRFLGRLGGFVVSPDEVLAALKQLWEEAR